MRFASFAALIALAGCPAKPSQTTPQPQAGGGDGPCPAASGVFIASYVTQDAKQGRTGWVLPLHAMQVDPGQAQTVPEYQQVDPATAAASGVPAAPAGTLWLMTAAAAPCRATPGKFYAAKLPGPPLGLSYGLELDGCPAPTDPQEAGGLAFVADVAPDGCRLEAPQPVAARMGEIDQKKQWHRPVREQAVPAALAATIPPHTCTPPSCEALWAVSEVQVQNQPVAWSGAFNWLEIGDPSQPCSWKNERYSGFWVPGVDGKPVKVEEGQSRPLVLSAVLVDKTGAKALLAEGPGEYASYELAPGKATLAHHVSWMLAPEDAWQAVDSLAPVCEKPAAAPAPLPKDAKPVSPY